MIKPPLSGDGAGLAIADQGAAQLQAWVGVVKGGVARALLAITGLALQHQRLGGSDGEVQLANLALHLEGGGEQRRPLGGKPPLLEPILAAVGPRQSRPLPTGTFILLVAATVEIRDGKLGQPELGG